VWFAGFYEDISRLTVKITSHLGCRESRHSGFPRVRDHAGIGGGHGSGGHLRTTTAVRPNDDAARVKRSVNYEGHQLGCAR
jgi:hypothetical protein